MRITMLCVFMMLSIVANSLALLLGIDEMIQYGRLVNWFTFAIYFIYYMLLGLYHMIARRRSR